MSQTHQHAAKKDFKGKNSHADFPGDVPNSVPFAELVYENSLHPVQVKICTPANPKKRRGIDKLLTELQCEV